MSGYLLGFDVGSSAVKASLIDVQTGKPCASATSPDVELEISSPRPGFAEQDPETWWKHVCLAAEKLKRSGSFDLQDVAAIGISYQMHGLVIVDKDMKVLRPAIIWCDSRAVEIGNRAFSDLGRETCLRQLLNSPGNFTASKLSWVKENEPGIYARIHKAMLPGDYIAMRMTGNVCTTPSGLSEAILWDFTREEPASLLLDYYGISGDLLPEAVPTFSVQGGVSGGAASALGVKAGTPVAYRAGDQPNNALSLNVLNPGEIAATAGTSGVVYGVSSSIKSDSESRVNTFLHVNHSSSNPRYGTLLCINGTGILNSWLRRFCSSGGNLLSYKDMDVQAGSVSPGADGVFMLPYGNGAERSLGNMEPGVSLHGLSLTRHGPAHVFRAAQEGIVFALNYGIEIMTTMGIEARKIRAGNANMFLSPVFSSTLAACTGAQIELFDTDGAQGAARGAGIGAGLFRSADEAFEGLAMRKTIDPDSQLARAYQQIYQSWRDILAGTLQP